MAPEDAETGADAPADDGESDPDAEAGGARRALRTVTPPYVGRPDAGMSAVGWTVFLGTVILLLPFLPLLLAVFGISKLLDAVERRR